MNYSHSTPMGSNIIKHNGDVPHGLDHMDMAWNDREMTDAFHQARNSGSGFFRNKEGKAYELKHIRDNEFALEAR
jgi:hypothetical protein